MKKWGAHMNGSQSSNAKPEILHKREAALEAMSVDGTGQSQNLDQMSEEIFHLQADGFWGSEKGFHDAEQLRRQ
jgi:hypothetical protein